MGFDKPDLGFVIHFQRPGSVVAYYQQVGRAGRALDDAVAILLSGREDDEIHDYFISTAFPGVELCARCSRVIEETPGIRCAGIEATINLKRDDSSKCLKFLEVDQAIYREKGAYYPNARRRGVRTCRRWDAVTERRRQELEEMKAFAVSRAAA